MSIHYRTILKHVLDLLTFANFVRIVKCVNVEYEAEIKDPMKNNDKFA